MAAALQNKRALVTGGSRGIGAAIVKRLAREGVHVSLTYVSKPDSANKTAAAAREMGVKAIAIQADSVSADAVTAAVEKTVKELGGIDILVNNAGIGLMAPIDEFRLEDFDRTFAVNVRAAFVAIQAAVKHMKEGGRVINIGSCNAERMPFVGGAAYAMSKAAQVGLVKGLAPDLGQRVKTVFPRVFPSHIARKASSARSIGRIAPISGSILDWAIRLIMFFMSSGAPMMEPVMVSWPAIIGRRFSGTSNPVVAPVITSVPPRASDDMLCAQESGPMFSTTAGTLRGRGLLDAKAWCAPSALACARPISVRLVAQTSKPAAHPSWMSAVAMPPVAPWISTVSPARSPDLVKSAR